MYVPSAKPKRRDRRKCLGCGKMFKSTGPGNRFCPACATKTAGVSKTEGNQHSTTPGWKTGSSGNAS